MRIQDTPLTDQIIGAAIEVHKILGPGLLESAYEHCLAQEFTAKAISFSRQISMPLTYKGQKMNCGYRLDFLIENEIILEIKAVDMLISIHEAQLLKLSGKKIGLLINFNSPILKNGIRRFVR